jgi:hypothetical protein
MLPGLSVCAHLWAVAQLLPCRRQLSQDRVSGHIRIALVRCQLPCSTTDAPHAYLGSDLLPEQSMRRAFWVLEVKGSLFSKGGASGNPHNVHRDDSTAMMALRPACTFVKAGPSNLCTS